MIVIVADHKNASGDSLYINTTGRHKRYETVSIRRTLLSILRIINGLISLITGLKCSKIINADNYVLTHVQNLAGIFGNRHSFYFSTVFLLNGKHKGLTQSTGYPSADRLKISGPGNPLINSCILISKIRQLKIEK
jgi:hypothetical protein